MADETQKISSPTVSTTDDMPPSSNAIVRHVDEPERDRISRRIARFNATEYPLIFSIYNVATDFPYLPLGFKAFLYDRRRFSDNTLFRLSFSVRTERAITQNGARGFPDGTSGQRRALALIRWMYHLEGNKIKLQWEINAVKKILEEHRITPTRSNLLRMKWETEFPLPTKGFSKRLKYYQSQSTSPKLICPLCYDNDSHQKVLLDFIASFHEHMVCHGQIEIFGCGKCRRIYPDVRDYENHACTSQEPKTKEFTDTIFAISCCECGFASRYDPNDVKEETVKKIQQILVNHHSHRLVILKLSTTKSENQQEDLDGEKPWTGQLKLKLRRDSSQACNLPGCQHIKLEDDRIFRQHLLTHMKVNRIPFLFTKFLKNCILPGYSGTPNTHVKRVVTPANKPDENDQIEIFETSYTDTDSEAENTVLESVENSWREEYKDTVAFKIRFDDSLPGVANATARTFLCKKCYLITFGNRATMSHIIECHNPAELKYTKKVICSENYCWQLGDFNHLPNEPISCIVENCKANLCSIQGFMIHFAEKHGLVSNIDYSSSGGYGSSHRTPWTHRESYMVQEVNQFCTLTTDGQLTMDMATNIIEGQYSEEVLAQMEDVDLGMVEGQEEEVEESEAELEPREMYPKKASRAEPVQEVDHETPMEIDLQPEIQIQVDEAPEENGLVHEQSSESDVPGPSGSNTLTVPRLKLKRPSLSTEARKANGLTDDELPSDYLEAKRRKDEKRREKWEKTQLERRRSRQTDEEIEATVEEVSKMTTVEKEARMTKKAKREEEKRKKKEAEQAEARELLKRVTEPIVFNFGNRCFDCGLEFVTGGVSPDEHYQRHGFYKPENPQTFSINCYRCNESFYNVGDYCGHVVRTHSMPNTDKNDPKNRTCTECAFHFTQEDFVNHFRYYCYCSKSCGQCGMKWKKTSKNADRKAHNNREHKSTRRFWCACKAVSGSFASLRDFERHECADKKLIMITVNPDLLKGTKLDPNNGDQTILQAIEKGNTKAKKREERLERLQQMVNDPATYPGSDSASESRGTKRKASELMASAVVANQLASATCVPIETGELLLDEDSSPESVLAEPSTSPAPSQSETTATSEGSKGSGILSQALKDAGIPTASQDIGSIVGLVPPSADHPEPVTSTSADQVPPEPAVQIPSTSSGFVNGESIVTTTTAIIEDDDEIVCLNDPLPDIEVLPVEPAAPAPKIALDGDDEIMEVDAPSTSRAERPIRFQCDICNKGFKTRGSMESHRINEHQRDIGTLDKRLTPNVYGIPFAALTFVCPHCVMVFEDQHRHQEHMKYHTELGVHLIICEFCTVQALSHDGLHKHLMNHGIDSTRPRDRTIEGNVIENWCTMCTPMLSFPSDAGYYLHVSEIHKVPIYYFCKNCLIGSCVPDPICKHIMTGHCTEQRVYERTMGFAIASDLHFQPNDEAGHVEKIRQSPVDYIKPHSCSTRSFLKYHPQNATCEEVEPGEQDKCFGLINFYSFENRHCQKLNYHVPDRGAMPKDLLPDHKFINLHYNLYRWLEWKVHSGPQPQMIMYDKRPPEQIPDLPPVINRYPAPAVGRINRAQPRMVVPPVMAGTSGRTPAVQRQASRSSRASSSSRTRPETQPTSNGNQAVTIQTTALQRVLVNCVPNPEMRVPLVESEYNQILGLLISARERNVPRGEVEPLQKRHDELRAMRHRLSAQIQRQQAQGPSFHQFYMDVVANEAPNYLVEMLPGPRAQAPTSRPLMDIQVAAPRPPIPQQDAAEILRPVHQNQQAVQPRADTRRTEETDVFKCAICEGTFSAKIQIRLMGKIEDFVNSILSSAIGNIPDSALVGIRQRMSRSTSICFQHVNPFAVTVINRDTFVINHDNHNMTTYNYMKFAYPALNEILYANVLRENSNLIHMGRITHERFLAELKKVNRCHSASCNNCPLNNMNSCKLHGFHIAGVGQLLCSHCWQSFSTEQNVIAHVLAVHSKANQHGRVQMDLRCPVPNCAVGFDSTANLRAHFEQAHKALFPHQSSCCSQVFASEASKNEHNATHGLVRSQRCCPLCGACNPFEGVTFGRFKNLTHLYRHACQIRYTCKICMEGFTTHAKLIAHCRGVHNIGGRAPLLCRYCANLPLHPHEVVHHITTTHELHLFGVTQQGPPTITCPPEITEFLGLSRPS